MLVVGNDYESQEIYVEISPSDRYVLDHITYSLNAYRYEKRKGERGSFVQPNLSDIPYPCLLSIQGIRHEVTFQSDTPGAFRLLGDDNLTVEIPTIENGTLVMNGVQAQYTSREQALPFPNIEKEIFIPPYTTQRITYMLMHEWFETEYILYTFHPKTKKQRIITGTLQSNIPTDNWIIERENIKK